MENSNAIDYYSSNNNNNYYGHEEDKQQQQLTTIRNILKKTIKSKHYCQSPASNADSSANDDEDDDQYKVCDCSMDLCGRYKICRAYIDSREYFDLFSRVQTFKANGWPLSIQQNPQILAEAGFIYTGFSDIVKCVFCGLHLNSWLPSDDPFVEHAQNLTRPCMYLKDVCGSKFIEKYYKRRRHPAAWDERVLGPLSISTTENKAEYYDENEVGSGWRYIDMKSTTAKKYHNHRHSTNSSCYFTPGQAISGGELTTKKHFGKLKF